MNHTTRAGRISKLRDRRCRVPGRDAARPLILLLQGPVGPFFHILRDVLIRSGVDVLKVNFNGGDWLASHGPGTINFCGSVEEWSIWLETFVRRSRPASVVLFGDSRPYHRAAIAVGRETGIAVWCLEEGYARPHFVTCELYGNNALSPLCRPINPHDDTEQPLDPMQAVTGNLFRAMAVHAVGYFIAKSLGAPFFLGNIHHRSRGLLAETFLWSRSFYRKIVWYYANSSFIQGLLEHRDQQYFIAALQVHDDQQLTRHGDGWTMERLITETIQSFAAHAEAFHRLVFKVHPMDRGHKSYRRLVTEIAAICGCADRVHVVDDGSIGLMIRHSIGVITVNSTSGLLALNHGKPLLVLGRAVYLLEGLATPGGRDRRSIDRFWRGAQPPNADAVKLFMNRMYRESQVNGSFYLRDFMRSTAERILARIREAPAENVVPLVPRPDESAAEQSQTIEHCNVRHT